MQICTLNSNLNSEVITRPQKRWKNVQTLHFFRSQFKTYYDDVKNRRKQLNEALKLLLRLRKSWCTCGGSFLYSISEPNFDPASKFSAENIYYVLFWKFFSKVWNLWHHDIGFTGEKVTFKFKFEFSVKICIKKP